MEFVTQNWWLILIVVISGVMLLAPNLLGTSNGLTPEQATQLVNRNNGVFIDIRNEHDYQAEHIAGAKNVPAKQLPEALPKKVKNKNMPIILVCEKGRSAFSISPTVRKLGYSNVQVLSGGVHGWKAANLPLTQDKTIASRKT